MSRNDSRALAALLGAVLLLVVGAALCRPHNAVKGHADIPAPTIEQDANGKIDLRVSEGSIRYQLGGEFPTATEREYRGPFSPDNGHAIEGLIHTPTSVQWRPPIGSFPEAIVVRACAVDEQGRSGTFATRTFLPAERSSLPVLSLVLPQGAFFDADTGLYVVGNAFFHTDEDFVQRYPTDQRWWKYPGNFHYRGKRTDRQAHLEYFTSAGKRVMEAGVTLRINGNNTRGFPQHALRVSFDAPLDFPLLGDDHGTGWRTVLFRTSGNDQDRTFFRDALQHTLCASLPFETSGYQPAVLYLDGAYWGLHNIRERMDAAEIARRHGLKKKQVTILADRLELYDGKEEEVKRFARLLTMAERWNADGQPFVDSLERRMDVDGFLTYVAAQLILGNVDWPEQNVKWWRFTGDPDTINNCKDGRWRWIMGDSDMGFGLVMGPEYDAYRHLVQRKGAPTTRLFLACSRSSILRARFDRIALALLDGPLSAEHMQAEAERLHAAIAPEMERHIRRWRRPLTMRAWEDHVTALITFARERGAHVRSWLPDPAAQQR